MAKPKVAFYWCASCGGCEEAVVDLAEDILGVVEAVDIVFWPVAMDFKKSDIAALPDGALAATLLNGAVRTGERRRWRACSGARASAWSPTGPAPAAGASRAW